MNSSLKQRLITAAVGLPVLLFSILLFPGHNHLFFSFVIVFVSSCGSIELKRNIIERKIKTPPTGYLGILLPLVEMVRMNFFPDIELTQFVLAAFIGIAFLYETIHGSKDNFELSLYRTAAVILNIIYPGLFMVYGIRLCHLPDEGRMIITFLCIVLGSDSSAYFFGRWFGKNNKGVVKCSPNKSIAGFIGGTVVIALIGFVLTLIFPSLLPFTPLQTFFLFLLTSVFGTAGDLFESMLKRSTGVKDAGRMIPGRGGMLDCIDSVSIAVPIFVIGAEMILL